MSTQSGGAPAVEVRNVWKVFGPHTARAIEMSTAGARRSEVLAATGCTVGVRDVSFSVSRGETFVVMGLSGSGKSTLVRCLSRLIEPTAGDVFIDGDDVLGMSPAELREVRRTKMSMVFQHFGLFPHKRVIDNVAYGLEVQKRPKHERREQAMEVLTKVGLAEWAMHYPQQLSGGMQQRVGLARALALDPAILLFDEPFSALDPLIRREMQDEIVRLRQELGKTMMFITHDLSEALRLGDRIAIMRDGRFVQVGTPAEVVLEPADEYVANFVRDVPRSHVVPVDAVMSAPSAGPFAGEVASGTKVRDAVNLVARSELPVRVVKDGRAVGTLDRVGVLSVIATEDL